MSAPGNHLYTRSSRSAVSNVPEKLGIKGDNRKTLFANKHTTWPVLFTEDKNDKFAATALDYGGGGVGGVVVCGIVTIPPYHNYPGLSTQH